MLAGMSLIHARCHHEMRLRNEPRKGRNITAVSPSSARCRCTRGGFGNEKGKNAQENGTAVEQQTRLTLLRLCPLSLSSLHISSRLPPPFGRVPIPRLLYDTIRQMQQGGGCYQMMRAWEYMPGCMSAAVRIKVLPRVHMHTMYEVISVSRTTTAHEHVRMLL